jgi:tetratricopeptide (TPR) repeat protein
MSTVALSMIVKDEYEQVSQLLAGAGDVFDEINIVVSDKPTANKLKAQAEAWDSPFTVKWREWNDHFDDARNVALDMCTTDYVFWLDADDSFDFTSIPYLVETAELKGLDAIFLPYNYMRDEAGNIITRHYRERLVKLGRGYSWRGWVHETLISDEKVRTAKLDSPVVDHKATIEDSKHSYERNHKILEKAYKATQDPRYLHYLGMSYFTAKDYNKAAELMSDYLEVGGSIEDIYRTLGLLSECAYHLGKFDLALEYATKQATLKPKYPMAYWLLAQYEADQENYEEALEWVKVSESKPDPDTLSVWDPSSRGRATLIAARCLFMLNRYNEALAQIRKIEHLPEVQDVLDDFYNEADAETFVGLLPKIRKFFNNDKQLWDALCHDIKYDTRIKEFRHLVNSPKKWDDKSIVIFCGQGYEEWGPHTLDKGMGGSEEAVVYLAPELAKLGYDVTVYAEAELEDKGVHYKHWKEIDTRDQFNIFISWRAPQYLERIDAKVKLADIHDVLPEALIKDYPDVTYLVKTKYHRDLYPKLADDKFAIIGNGIKQEQFKGAAE